MKYSRPGVNNTRAGGNNARIYVFNAREVNNTRFPADSARPGIINALIFILLSNLLFKALGDLCQQNNLKTFKNFLYLE